MVWLDPWGGSREKKHAGEEIGCELALRHLKHGDQEVYVKDMTAGGPGALSGQLAIGDAIDQINGTDPLDASSGVAKSLVKLVEGETGTPVWLRIKGVRKHVVLIQRAALCLKPAPASSTAGGLGFTFQEQRTAEGGVEVVVIEIKAGGAIWLAGQYDEEVIFVGDVITHVDGKKTTGNAVQFKGAQFSRVCLAGRRGRDNSRFEITIVRIATLPQQSLEMVSAYRASVATIPPAPPSDRVNANAARDECLDALTINGIDIKTAAKIVVAAYKLQEQSPSQTPQKAAPTPSRFPSPSTHPKSPSKQSAPSAFPSPSTHPKSPSKQSVPSAFPSPSIHPKSPSKQSAPSAFPSPIIHPKSPRKQSAPSAFPGRRQAAAKCASVHCLTPMSPLALVKDAANKTDVTDQQEPQGEQGIGQRSDQQGECLTPADMVGVLTPDMRFHAVALVCAIAAPSLLLHKKLAFAKLTRSTNSKEHKERELWGEDKESEELRGEDKESEVSRGSPKTKCPPQLSPSNVVGLRRASTWMLGSRHDDIMLGCRHTPSDAPSPATTCTTYTSTSPHASPHKPPMDKPEERAGEHGPPCSASGTNKVHLHSRAAPAYSSPQHRPQLTAELAAKGSSWSSWQLQQLRVPRSPHSPHVPSSPHSPHTLPKSASRWRRWLRWRGGAAEGGEGRGEEEAGVGGVHCPHQTHEAHQGEEALLWHTHYLDFLSDFMLVEEGRAETLMSILHSNTRCQRFALNHALTPHDLEPVEPSREGAMWSVESEGGMWGLESERDKSSSCLPTATNDDLYSSNSLLHDGQESNATANQPRITCLPRNTDRGGSRQHRLLHPDTLLPMAEGVASPRLHHLALEHVRTKHHLEHVSMQEVEVSEVQVGAAEASAGVTSVGVCPTLVSSVGVTEVLAPPPSGGGESCARRCSQEAWSICWLVLAASVGSRHYDARSRSIVRHLSKMLLVPWRWVRTAEIVFCKEIIKATAPSKVDKQDAEGWDKKRWARYGLIGGGAVAGGVLLAVTGGLATPAIVAGLGLAGAAVAGAGMVGAGAAGFAASVAAFGGLSTALSVSFGAAGAGLVGYKMHRRTSDIQEFEFELMDCSPGLPVTIGIHGWLTDETDSPWKIWGAGGVLVGDENDGGEAYALRWESTELRTLGQAISKLLESQAQSAAVNMAGTAVLGAAFAAIALPFACAGLFDYVDNSWSVVQQRADRAGEELANSLLARLHGNRPVTLIGYGMGARVIIKCLLALAAAPTGLGHGIVETCVLIGTPYSADAQEWARASSVCAYRLVNAYNTRDWLLAFAYRANSASGMLGRGVAGLRSVEHVNGNESILENVDLSDHISSSHFAYRDKVKELVCALGTHTGVVDLGLITPDPSLSQQLMAGVSLRRSPSTDKGVKDTGRGVGGVGEREEDVGERPPSPCKLDTEYTEEALLTHFLEDHQLILT